MGLYEWMDGLAGGVVEGGREEALGEEGPQVRVCVEEACTGG